ncbi:MAG: zinc ABC transporter substrate-binding protein [Mycobacteriaceae bacterium]
MRLPRLRSPGPALPVLTLVAALTLAGCSTAAGRAPTSSSSPISIVAAENFWGSIAAQLGGDKVKITSIINSPDADPHDYEATAADGREVATADMVIINGVGYDGWATKLAEANPSERRTDLTVGSVVGVKDGGNPHRWYNPGDVTKVTDAITADLKKRDPADAAYFETQKQAFTTTARGPYDKVVADIKTRYSGLKVGASESIVAMIAPALGLDLVTPPDFLTAISEGTDPTAADKKTIDAQISAKEIKVYIYNSQNATPDVQAQVDAAKAQGIPVTTITETMTPATDSWEQWQTRQLVSLQKALAQAAA